MEGFIFGGAIKGFLRYEFVGLIFGRGIYMEGLIFGSLRYMGTKNKNQPPPSPRQKKNRPATQANLWPAERGEGPQLG